MEYTEVKRDDRIDMDPYYYAPEVLYPIRVLLCHSTHPRQSPLKTSVVML